MNKQEAIEELTHAQEWFKQKTYELAESAGIMRSDLWPMPDGVYDIEAYLSSLRVMWVLKEPYDDFVDGKPCGGGWDVYGAFDNSDAWANRTWQPIIYSMYGVFNHLRWRDMDYIRDNPDMVNVLKRIAYINLSKMPAHKQTNDAKLWEYYDIWRPMKLMLLMSSSSAIRSSILRRIWWGYTVNLTVRLRITHLPFTVKTCIFS